MPNIPPKKPSRQVPSGERIKQMLTGSMVGAMPVSVPSTNAPEHLMEYAMRQYPYAPQQFSPEEKQAYSDVFSRNERSFLPLPTDVPADYYDGMFNKYDGTINNPHWRSGGKGRPFIDSLYTASRIEDAERAMNNADLSEFARRMLTAVPGSRVISRKPY